MSRRNTELLLLIASAFPVILLYAMYVLTAGAAISFETLAVPIGLFAAFAAAHIAVRILAPGADPAILPIVFVLSGIGITFVTRLAPTLAISQLVILFISVALMVGTLALVKNLDVVMRYKYTFGIIGIILLMLPIFIGTTISGSKLWIRIAGFTIQPGEFAKVFIVLFLAGYLAENRELLSISNRKILGLKIPRLRLLLPLFAVWGVCLLVVVFERDLGSALLFYTIFLLMLYVATGRFSYVIIGLVLLAVGAVGAYKFLSHVQVRFQIWPIPLRMHRARATRLSSPSSRWPTAALLASALATAWPTTSPSSSPTLSSRYRRGDGPFGRWRRSYPVYALCRTWPDHGSPCQVRPCRL